MAAEEWRTIAFRQNVVHKIEEHMQQSQAAMSKTASEMEQHVYARAPVEGRVSVVCSEKKPAVSMLLANNANAVQKAQNQQNTGQPGSSGNIASNLLQSLNQRPGQPMNIQQSLQNKMSGINMLQSQQMGMNQMGQMPNMQGSPMMQQANQMNQGNISQQMGPQPGQQQQIGVMSVGSQIQQAMQNQIQNQMGGNQMGGPMNPAMQSAMQVQQSPMQQQQQQQQQHMNQMNAAQMNIGQIPQQQLGHMQRKIQQPEMMNAGYPGQRNITPNQFLRQSPSPSAPSPSGLGAPGSNQMVPSPALVSSPNPQLLGGPRSIPMAPSPSTSLNTPAGMLGGTVPSPIQDDQIKEKIQKLRKYIDPLKRMISKMTLDGYTEKTYKMKKLLELLTNPSSVTKLEVLEKCEVALERMDFKKCESISGPTIPSTLKEHQFLTPLLEVVGTLLQGPVANHTLYRTFGPCVEALSGPEIKGLPLASKKRKIEESPSEIPDVLQGEIARLDQRFKISLDPAQQNGSKCIQLICWLDDKHLPCVPPITVIVPSDYPTMPPRCVLASHEYATPYLSAVQNGLNARLAKFPKRYSVSQLLDTWEMSVRQACAPKAQQIEKTEATSKTTVESVKSSTAASSTIPVSNGISTNLISSAAS